MSLAAISIVVASCNRQASLDRLVGALSGLDYPKELIEVLVVDDGSDPPVRLARAGPRIHVLHQRRAGPASARNAGIRATSGELIVFFDDDCLPCPGWLRQVSKAYLEHPRALIGGRTQNALTANRYSSASQALVDYLYEYLGRTSSPNYFLTTSNIAGSREGFNALGGFDESFVLPAAEDRDLCDRWKVNGPLTHMPQAVVDHYHHLSFAGYVRQQFGYGRGARVLHMKRCSRRVPFRFERLSFYAGLFAFPFRSARAHSARGANSLRAFTGAIADSLLFLLAQTCNVAGYLYQAALGRKRISADKGLTGRHFDWIRPRARNTGR